MNRLEETLIQIKITKSNCPDLYNQALTSDPHYHNNLSDALCSLHALGILPEGAGLQFYEAMIENARDADKLAAALGALKEADISLETHRALYDAVIRNARNADKLAAGFGALKEAGASLETYRSLYDAVIEKAFYADKLAASFGALKEAGAGLKNHEALYDAVIRNVRYRDKLALAFRVLAEAGISLETHPAHYDAVIKKVGYADKLAAVSGDKPAAAFKVLAEAGAGLKTHEALYDDVIRFAHNADKLAAAFKVLAEAGISPKTHRALYDAVIGHVRDAAKLAAAFGAIKEAGARLKTHEALYDAVIRNPCDADKLAAGFGALKEAGASLETHQALYNAAIQNAHDADQFEAGFGALKEAGASLNTHQALYDAAIRNACDADKIAAGFGALKEVGASLNTHQALYDAAIQNAHDADKLAPAFKVLAEAGISLGIYSALYDAAIQNASEADKLAAAFVALKEAGANLETHQALYDVVIRHGFNGDKLAATFKALAEAGIGPKTHPEIYDAVIEKAFYADKLAAAFGALKEAGASLETHLELYDIAIKQAGNDNFKQCLILINDFNLNMKQHATIIENILEGSPGINLEILQWIEKKQFNIDSLQYLFETLFSGKAPLNHSPYLFSKVQLAIDTYFEMEKCLSNKHECYAVQCFEIQSIIHAIIQEEEMLTEGPLNKSSETCQLEALLTRLCQETIENVDLHFDEATGYILKFKGEPEIVLSELLRLANFNHLELSHTLIENMGRYIGEIAHDFKTKDLLDSNLIVKRLPEPARYALGHYIGNRHYMNVNRFFRGVRQNNEERYTWLAPVDDKPNLLANFLTGCLVNWAAAELPRVLVGSEERRLLERVFLDIEDRSSQVADMLKGDEQAYQKLLSLRLAAGTITEEEYTRAKGLFHELPTLFPSYGLVDRGEKLEKAQQEGELAVGARRTANPLHTPSVTSFSVHESGSSYFHKDGTVRTKVETDNSNRTVINRGEGEILTPAGTSYSYTANPQGGFFAREVNSPAIQPKLQHWSSTAIAEAYQHHLRQPYKESNHQTTVNDTTVQRPNHGLAHEYRVMTYIDVVIDYFAHHAKDDTFKLFCQYITPEEREWLQVAAAYSITGRESEISAGEDLNRYEEFREACKNHMEDFLDKYPPPSNNPDMRERMLHIVRWMGNPAYENEYQGNPALNTHADEDERDHRNYIHRILTIAHKLDLPRCYGPSQFEKAMEKCLELSHRTKKQQNDYNRMVRYAVDLNRAHGNALQTDISQTGKLVSANEGYREPFDKVSTHLRQVREMTESIKRPQVAEQYQFPICEDKDILNRILRMCGLPHEPPANDLKPN